MTKYEKLCKLIPAIYQPGANRFIGSLLQAWGTAGDDVDVAIGEGNKQIFAATAEDIYLDRIGANAGIERPKDMGMLDQDFRKLVPALSFAPKQVRQTIEDVLEIFYGTNSVYANTTTTVEAPYALVDSYTITFRVDNETDITVTFNVSDFASISAATALEVANAINKQALNLNLVAEESFDNMNDKTYVRVRTLTSGSAGSIQIIGGYAQNILKFPEVRTITHGTTTQWDMAIYSGDIVRLEWTGVGLEPDLSPPQIGDLLIISGPFNAFNEGTFTIENISIDAAINAPAMGTLGALAEGAGGVVDNQTFTISDGVTPYTYTFDSDGSAPPNAVTIGVGDTAAQVHAAIVLAINASAIGVTASGVQPLVVLTNDTNGIIGNVAITEVVGGGTSMSPVGMAGGRDIDPTAAGLKYTGTYVEFRNTIAANETVTQTSDLDVTFYYPYRAIVAELPLPAMLYEVNHKEVVIQMPSTSPIITRDLIGASHIHPGAGNEIVNLSHVVSVPTEMEDSLVGTDAMYLAFGGTGDYAVGDPIAGALGTATVKGIISNDVGDTILAVDSVTGSFSAGETIDAGSLILADVSPSWLAANDFAYSMAVFGGKLYVGTHNGTAAQVWSYDGSSWVNTNIPCTSKYATSMAVFAGKLYVGTDGPTVGSPANVWSYDGTTWVDVSPVFPAGHIYVVSMAVLGAKLYAGTLSNFGGAAQVWSYDGTTWLNVSPGWAAANINADSMAVLGAKLYVGSRNNTKAQVWSYDGFIWANVTPGWTAWNTYAKSMTVLGTNLYVGTYNGITGIAEVWSYDGFIWANTAIPWLFGNTYALSMSTLGTKIYVGSYNSTTTIGEVWSYDGVTWVDTGATWVAGNDRAPSMSVLGTKLYIGTYNAGGAQVWYHNPSGTGITATRNFSSLVSSQGGSFTIDSILSMNSQVAIKDSAGSLTAGEILVGQTSFIGDESYGTFVPGESVTTGNALHLSVPFAGTFVTGETVTGPSGASATVLGVLSNRWNRTTVLCVSASVIAFAVGELITGGTSAATARATQYVTKSSTTADLINIKAQNETIIQGSMNNVSGSFTVGEMIIGGTSGAMAVMNIANTFLAIYEGSITLSDWAGTYVFDDSAVYSPQDIVGTIAQSILTGMSYNVLSCSALSSDFPAEGYVVFDYGLATEDGPVKYTAKPNSYSLIIDPSYKFQNDHASGSTIRLVTLGAAVIDTDGSDYPAYVTGLDEALVVLEAIIRGLVAAGVVVRLLVKYPEIRWSCFDKISPLSLGVTAPALTTVYSPVNTLWFIFRSIANDTAQGLGFGSADPSMFGGGKFNKL